MDLETRKISLKVVVIFTDKAVFSNTGKHLSNIESLVLEETLNGKKYPEIAAENGYTIEYLKNDVGPKLWRRLSFTFGEKINKANVKIVISNRLYHEQEKTKLVTVSGSVEQPQQIAATFSDQKLQKQPLSSPLAINQASSDSKMQQLEKIAQVYFEKSLKSLRGTSAHHILMALFMFPNGAVEEAIITLTGLTDINIFINSLTQLQQMFLIEEREQKYCLIPVIRSYLAQELTCYPEVERLTRERWISWYLKISQRCHDLNLEKERENILEVIDWCINHNLYNHVNQLWPIIKSYWLHSNT